MNLRILFPIGTFYPAQSGGPSNSIYWLAKALVQQGMLVTVITTNTDQPESICLDQWLETEAGRIRYVRTQNHRLPWRLIRQSIQLLSNVDVVHMTSLFYPLSFIVACFAHINKKQIIWSPHGELAEPALTKNALVKRLILFLYGPFFRHASFHTTSPVETAQVRRHFGNVRIIEEPNCMFLPERVTPNAQSGRYLLYLGRLHPIKGLNRLLKAVAKSAIVKKEHWQLRIVGPDTDGYGDKLRKLATRLTIADLVQFEIPVSGSNKEELLANAHALILPSHSENFGNVVIEALAQGTPVIASTGSPWQVLEQREAGFWTDNSVTALQIAIDTCLSLPDEQHAQYRERAYALAHEQFNIEQSAQRWVKNYQSLFVK